MNNKYIVINEKEIVKAETFNSTPATITPANYDIYINHLQKWKDHCLSLPRIPIQGKHNWKVWQEVVEGKDFTLGKQFLNENDEWQELHFFKSIWDDLNDEYKRVVAIPMVEQTKSEQGESDLYISLLNQAYNIISKIEPTDHFLQVACAEWVEIYHLLTNDNTQTK